MAHIGTDKYRKDAKKGKYNMPYTMDPDKKDKEYYCQWAQYIWSQYVSDRTLVPYGGYATSGRTFEELRLYGVGLQPKSIYMNIIDPCEGNENEGYLNINWDNVQIMPKFRDVVRGKMLSMDFEVTTTAIDESSIKERIDKVNKLKLLLNPAMRAIIEETGIIPDGIELPPGINTIDDVEMYNKMGGLRLSHEIMIQDAIEATNYESNWNTIKAQIVEDIIDLNVCATHTYVERATGIVKRERVDPLELICRPSKYQDHRDIDFAGFVKKKTIQEIRIESDLSEEELYAIAKTYKGFGNNTYDLSEGPIVSGYQRTYRDDYLGSSEYRPYDNFTVDVMTFYFIGKEAERYILGRHHKDGNMIYDRVSLDSKLDKRDVKRGKEIKDEVVEYVYKARWVVGTNFIYDEGKEYAVVRENANGIKRARLPIHIYSDRSPSIVERCIPFIDDIQLAVLKKRNTLSKMAPGPRMAIDLSLVEDTVTIGNQDFTMLQLLEIFPKTGVMAYSSVGEYEDSEMAGSNRPPISFMPSGITEDVQILLNDVAFGVSQIRDVTGINEVTDGSVQQQDMLIGVMEGLMAASNNALKPHYQLYYGLEELQSRYIAQKWQVSVLSGEINAKFLPIGDNILKPVKISKDLYDYDFGIKVMIKPTQEDKQLMLQQLTVMQQQSQLAMSDFFVVYNMVQAGDYKKAQLYLAKANEQFMALQHQRSMEQMQAQTQGNAEAAAMAEQARMQTEVQLKQLEMQMEEMRHQLRLQENQQKHEHRLREIMAKEGATTERDLINKASDMAINEDMT